MAQRTHRRMPSVGRSEEEAILRRVGEALSDDESRRVLACALLVLDDQGRRKLIELLGPETGAALGAVLAPPTRRPRGSKPAGAVAGKGKVRQEWDRLWEQWAAVIAETGEKDGKYVEQDAHWETPYIDSSSISEDLDAIAARMRPLIRRVIDEDLEPGSSITQAIDEMDDELYAGLPEWIEPAGEESCCLGPEATACLLEWEWSVAQRMGRDAAAFLDGIRDLESRLENVALDADAITTFVLGLSDRHLQTVLESMTRQRSSPRWAEAFTSARGCWAGILRELARRWNPDLHAETSRANIAQDWTLALPLLRNAVKRKSFAEASTLVDDALRSRLRLAGNERWEPRKEMFPLRAQAFYGDDRIANLETLLRLWQKTAQAQGTADLAAALAIQVTALRKSEDGEAMLEAFRAVPAEFHAMRETLFADWRNLIVQQTLQAGEDGEQVACGGWVPALVDAARTGPEGAAAFQAAVRSAIEEALAALAIKRRPAGGLGWSHIGDSDSSLSVLATLTLDIDATAPAMSRSSPKLFKLIREHGSGAKDRLAATRLKWCQRLGGPSLIPEVLAFWRDHAVRFVPDPGNASGDYSPSADWLAAVQELNPAAARELLGRWATTHHRRRNLWSALAERGVPLPAGVRSPAGSSSSARAIGRDFSAPM